MKLKCSIQKCFLSPIFSSPLSLLLLLFLFSPKTTKIRSPEQNSFIQKRSYEKVVPLEISLFIWIYTKALRTTNRNGNTNIVYVLRGGEKTCICSMRHWIILDIKSWVFMMKLLALTAGNSPRYRQPDERRCRFGLIWGQDFYSKCS